ncbi:hypothetical protein F4861DRAFT_221985 [Xylaria intraflava]|nr:hypothetical protein F4861DRAFT_221985 [Xylaria intraflava]
MPDEEMEMTFDFSHGGFGEDIDIDLDFPVGQPDEDMDLGDFDRPHEIQNFNSDTRDELMAEGDDSSYGMIDAIEVDRNASTAPGNDIDVDLEHVEAIWRNPSHSVDFNPDSEINYLDEATGESAETGRDDIETTRWLPLAETSAQDAGAMDHANEVTVDIALGEPQSHGHPLVETHEPLTTSRDVEGSFSPDVNLKETRQSIDVETLHGDEEIEVMTRVSDKPSNAERDEHSATPNAGPDSKFDSANLNREELHEELTSHYPDEIDGQGSNHADESHIPHDFERPEHPSSIKSSDVKDEHVDALPPEEAEEADQSADDASGYQLGAESYIEPTNDQAGLHDSISEYQLGVESHAESTNDQAGLHGNASEYQLGDESYIESANDQIGVHDDAPQAESAVLSGHNPQSVGSSPGKRFEGDRDEVEVGAETKSPSIKVSDRDDPIELADHYGVYISYGETDYNLFANAEDDDPNEYFLSDKSALDVPLAQFLGSLREIISDEISPLDELVMHVDGLGLEFSESTTLDFLGKFTFGDLVILYDKLAKNEQAESSPPIYTYLTMRPNCNRRMMALGESANAGRGLSEVALYHDSPSIGDWQGSDMGSPHTDILLGGDYNDGENSNDYLQDDEDHEDREDREDREDHADHADHADHEDHEEGDPLSDGERNLSQLTVETRVDHTPDSYEQPDELINESEEKLEGNSGNTGDNEQDISVSKQGISPFISHCTFPCNRDSVCPCDDCYEIELQHLAGLVHDQVWPNSGTTMPIHSTPTHMTSITNRNVTEDDATIGSSVLQSQEASEEAHQPSLGIPETGGPELPAPTTSTTNATDVPTSDNTSVTATLDGEDDDEIDYDSDEDGETNHDGSDESSLHEKPIERTADVGVSIDDEITWESDDEEDAKHDTKVDSPKDTVQVLSVPGKRQRSDSDALDGAGDENDHKRRRS